MLNRKGKMRYVIKCQSSPLSNSKDWKKDFNEKLSIRFQMQMTMVYTIAVRNSCCDTYSSEKKRITIFSTKNLTNK